MICKRTMSNLTSFPERRAREEPWRLGEKRMVAMVSKATLLVAAVICVVIFYFAAYNYLSTEPTVQPPGPTIPRSSTPKRMPPPGPCTCPAKSFVLRNHLPKGQYEELQQRRAKEFQQHKARTTSVLSKLLFALPNSPLQYPTQGFTVQPLTSSLIPGIALHFVGQRSSYKVTLNVTKGILTTEIVDKGVTVQGSGGTVLSLESSDLYVLNHQLSEVSYTSTVYHIHTGDLVSFQFENHEAVFPIVITHPQVPVLYDMGTDISSHVTITTKTFLRYTELKVLLSSIRKFYSNIKVIIADDSFEPEKITGENIQHYIMPPAQGWFAGRNLAVSQVTTKYFLWVDDDFLFTENTKIEKLVEVMEAVPDLDVLGGSVGGNQFYFSLVYQEGDEEDGGCLNRKSNRRLQSLPGYPQCSLVSGVVNFFLARTAAVQRVGFDPKLQRVAHSEFFMDGLGSLLVATCSHVSIGHQRKSGKNKDAARYSRFRHPPKQDENFKLRLHFFKNHLKCITYG